MKPVIKLFFLGGLLLPFSGAAASDLIDRVARESHPNLVCEVEPRDGAEKSYMIFHLLGFNDEAILRYRGITVPPLEFQITLDGEMVSEKSPCNTDPVPFP